MKYLYLLLLSSLLLVSCKSTGEDLLIYNVDISQKAVLNDYVHDYSFVRLETRKDCLLGTPQKIEVTDSMISLLDHDKIFFFDRSGKFISKVDRIGKGGDEYISITDFTLQDTLAYVLVRAQKTIYVYDLNGNLNKKISLKVWYAHLRFCGKDTLVLSSENANESGKNFLVYDVLTDSVIAEYDDFKNNENLLFDTFSPFAGYDHGLLLIHPFDYSVYRLGVDGMDEFCKFKFKTKESSDFIQKGGSFNELMEKSANKNVVKYLGSLCRANDNMYLTFDLFDTVGGVGTHLCKIDPKGKITNVRLFEKFDKKFPYLTAPIVFYNGTLVSFASASWILHVEKEHKLTKFHQMGLTKEDNYIVFFHNLW